MDDGSLKRQYMDSDTEPMSPLRTEVVVRGARELRVQACRSRLLTDDESPELVAALVALNLRIQ